MNKKEVAYATMALANKIKKWDYTESVKKMRGIVKQWKSLTIEAVRELYFAKEYLTSQKGQRRDPDAEDYIMYTWNDYCDEICFPRQHADYYINKFFVPKELSDNGKDMLMLEAPAKEDTTAAKALAESRIEKVLSGGKRPSNWTDKEEAELKRRLENARFAEQVEKYNAPVAITKTDYFAEAMKRSKDIVNFKLETREQVQAQINIFRHIESYLNIFEDPEIKARAAFNLALKTRNLSNELAEQNFQLSESVSEKESENDS